jgi:hypothetical protein
MNYLKIYIKLIRNSLNRKVPDSYVERHHVFPRSIFGDKNNKFVVKLTAREHYIAHALLEKIYIKRYGKSHSNTRKMISAFFMMNNTEGKGQKRYINSKLYEQNKLLYIESISGVNNKLYGKKRIFTKEHLEKIRQNRPRGENHVYFGKSRPEEHKIKMRKKKHKDFGSRVSEGRKGIVFTDEHKLNLSLAHKGKTPGNKGKSKFTLKITNPLGETVTTNNLAEYCNKNGIPNEEVYLIRVARGIRKQHKKFTAILVSIKE